MKRKQTLKQVLTLFVAVLMVMAISSPLLAQQPSSTTDASQHHGMQGTKGSDGMMSGKAGMCSGGMMCPMMGSGMGMGMMALMAIFAIAAIFAFIAVGMYLLRRSRTPAAP